jgi:S1-C subfamily serine protease
MFRAWSRWLHSLKSSMFRSSVCLHLIKSLLTAFFLLICVFTGLATPALAEEPSQLYQDWIGGVVWIQNHVGNSVGGGSGFLVDKQRRLVVTNQHVAMDEETMDVFFPVRYKGKIINEQQYYKNNIRELRKTGHYNVGRVVAVAPAKDLAILRIGKIPDSAVEFETAAGDPDDDDRLYLLGNPANRDLWRFGPGVKPSIGRFKGEYLNDSVARDYKKIRYTVSSFGGNSGGPVLNARGKVVGVHSSSAGTGGSDGGAVHWSEVDDLLDTIKTHRVFSIENTSNVKLFYQIRWGDGQWKDQEVAAKWTMVHWNTADSPGSPQIRFACSADNVDLTKEYELDTYTSYLGRNVEPKVDVDAMEYTLQYDKSGRNIDLYKK